MSVITAGVLVTLVAVAMVQARQFAALTQALAPEDDVAAVAMFRLESDYLSLREQWRRSAAAAGTAPSVVLAPLREPWRTWVRQVHALRDVSELGDEGSGLALAPALPQIDAFVAAADPVLGSPRDRVVSDTFAADLLPRLEALGPLLRRQANDAAGRMTARSQQRVQALRSQGLLGMAVTLLLATLTVGFAAFSLRQVRRLRRRRRVYDALADELRQAQRDAVAAGSAKSAFLANMSHEIRTPFQGLMGMLSLLRETGLDARQTAYLHTATESADHLLAMLNDILDMSRLDSGRMTLVPAPLDLRGLLREVESSVRPRASAKNLVLHLEIDPSLPEQVLADGPRIKQILCNLLGNAIKFSDHGAVLLGVQRSSAADGAPWLEFTISDSGIGMDEATIARLFDRFMQADPSTRRLHGGSGLGLEIARRLAQLMGGDMAVQSQPGVGSRFDIRLPLHAVPLAASPPAPGRSIAASAPHRPLQVLVAEDHPVNRQVMAALLQAMGHEAHFAADGQEAVQVAQRQHFDLLLMDLHMPVMDGIGATRAIRSLSDPSISTVPIVALTADAFDDTRERCLVAGMNDFLTKPVSPQSLRSALRRLFGSTQAGEPEGPSADGGDGLDRHRGTAYSARSSASGHGRLDHQPPLIDLASVRMLLQAMPAERYNALVASFLDQGPDTVQRLQAAVRDAQPLELRVNAHAARGAALNLGLHALAATAEALQAGAEHLPAHEIARLVQRYAEQLASTRQAVLQLHVLQVDADDRIK